MSTQGPAVKRHITEHEQGAGIAPPEPIRGGVRFDEYRGIRAALRHKFKLNGLHPTDDKMHFTDDEFASMLDDVRGHEPAQSLTPAKKEAARIVMPKPATHAAEPVATENK